ncbi:hypothetical protein C8R47DRAFT_1158332 [Mycena vitilis]|nr:hypothetical protein C8R47DRAFT_1158332 [Mycena vitilis]
MRLWAIAAAILITLPLHPITGDIPSSSCVSLSALFMAANVTPGLRDSTPSPGPLEQPSSGPNPIFVSPPKRRGGQLQSIKTKRLREAAEEEHSWTPEPGTVAEESRKMLQKLAEAAAEKKAEDEAAAARAERERTSRVYVRVTLRAFFSLSQFCSDTLEITCIPLLACLRPQDLEIQELHV